MARLGLSDENFDVVVCVFGIFFVPNMEELTSELWRMVKRGGRLAVNPDDELGTETLENVFHIELEVDRPIERIGGRMYVRFDHGEEPLGRQWYRRLRQLLLRQFDA